MANSGLIVGRPTVSGDIDLLKARVCLGGTSNENPLVNVTFFVKGSELYATYVVSSSVFTNTLYVGIFA